MEQNGASYFDHSEGVTAVVWMEKPGRAFRDACTHGFPKRIHINKTSASAGFTLVELLIVIAVIALMVAILVPSLALTKRCARAAVCAANLHRIGVGLNLYAQDSKGFYPRALPLAPGADYLNPADWEIPWPSTICPMFWQAGYPSLLAPYLTDADISNPFDYATLPRHMDDSYIELFSCPDNRIPREDVDKRKCNYPLDYGLHNRASQNRQTDRLLQGAFLVADQTWGLAYIPETAGPNTQAELQGWWNPFIHLNDTINVLYPTFGVDRISQERFIVQFNTANPPDDDPL